MHLRSLAPKAGLWLALLTGAILTTPTAQAQILTLGQSGSTTLTGAGTLTATGTTASGTYIYDDAGAGMPLASQYDYTYWYACGPSTAHVSGGRISELVTYATSTANVNGGSFDQLETYDTSVLDLFGTGLSETFLESDSDYQLNDVTGTLQDGDSLNALYFDYGGKLSFNSPVPEVSSVVSLGVLLMLGLGGMAVNARRRKSAVAE